VEGLSFTSVLAVAAIALAAPLIVLLAPRLRMPAVVLEIVLGIVVGPSLLDWVRVDVPLSVLSLVGLAFLLFLAGLEIDPAKLRHGFGRILLAYGVSLLLASVFGFATELVHETEQPLFIALALASTSLGLVVPVLSDARQNATEFGQLVLAASSVAEFGSIVLVSMFFSQHSESSSESTIFLLVAFAVLVGVVGFALTRAGRSLRVSKTLLRLDDTTAELGVRVAVLLLIVFVALAGELGLETILGAFVAGALLRVVDPERHLVHERFRIRVEAIGYGFLIPVFFVTSGLRFDAKSLFAEPAHLGLVPLFLVGIFVSRALPAILYRPLLPRRRVQAAALLQATSLTFPVVSAHLGVELGVFDEPTAAALVAAGLVSVLLFPPVALMLLARDACGSEELEGRA
jgi:Kef-type K+ transport system membrane component KefB